MLDSWRGGERAEEGGAAEHQREGDAESGCGRGGAAECQRGEGDQEPGEEQVQASYLI